MTSQASSEASLLSKAREAFTSRFGRAPTAAACAPGRVNLIGDHVDYCDGFVLPAALQYSTLLVGSLNGTTTCNVLSLTEGGQQLQASFQTTAGKLQDDAWANYVLGVVHYFPALVPGFDAVIVSDVPMGSGVSSSAALEVATFTFLEALTGVTVDPVKKALACQKAEHDFAGMPCGIMDQFVSTMAKKDHALLIDCRSLEATHIPLKSTEVVILVINSNVKHKLTGSEYPQRRSQCKTAAELLVKPSLRSVQTSDLPVLDKLNAEVAVKKRAQHVVSEIQRTDEAAKSLKDGDFKRVGKLFYESHQSLSELMEVSCPELDQLVDIARSVPGVLGARMTGGGFGGCVVSLVHKDRVEDLQRAITSQYKGNPTFFICSPSDGARVLDL